MQILKSHRKSSVFDTKETRITQQSFRLLPIDIQHCLLQESLRGISGQCLERGQKSVQQGDHVPITVQSCPISSNKTSNTKAANFLSQLFWFDLSPVRCKASTPVIIQHPVPSVELRHKLEAYQVLNPRIVIPKDFEVCS